MHHIDIITLGDGNDQRHYHDNGRKDVHHATDDQQKHIEHDQEGQLVVDIEFHKLHGLHRHLLVHQIAGKAHRRAQNDQDGPDQHHAVDHQLGQLPQGMNVLVHPGFDDEHIHHRHRRRLGDRKDAAINSKQDEKGQGHLPGGLPQGGTRFLEIEGNPWDFELRALPHAVEAQNADHQ